MELLCVELVLKRKELLGISNDESDKLVDEEAAKKEVYIYIYSFKYKT
jgi:hypothetical protein